MLQYYEFGVYRPTSNKDELNRLKLDWLHPLRAMIKWENRLFAIETPWFYSTGVDISLKPFTYKLEIQRQECQWLYETINNTILEDINEKLILSSTFDLIFPYLSTRSHFQTTETGQTIFKVEFPNFKEIYHSTSKENRSIYNFIHNEGYYKLLLHLAAVKLIARDGITYFCLVWRVDSASFKPVFSTSLTL